MAPSKCRDSITMTIKLPPELDEETRYEVEAIMVLAEVKAKKAIRRGLTLRHSHSPPPRKIMKKRTFQNEEGYFITREVEVEVDKVDGAGAGRSTDKSPPANIEQETEIQLGQQDIHRHSKRQEPVSKRRRVERGGAKEDRQSKIDFFGKERVSG